MYGNGAGVQPHLHFGLDERGADLRRAQVVPGVGNGSANGELFLMDANGDNRRSLGVARAHLSPTGTASPICPTWPAMGHLRLHRSQRAPWPCRVPPLLLPE
jgi:hypothetical protein